MVVGFASPLVLNNFLAIEPHEETLLKLAAADVFREEELGKLIGSIRFDEIPGEFILTLALFCLQHGWQGVPKCIVPRIEGYLKAFHTSNAALLAAFGQVGKELNRMNIPILLLKSAAIKAASGKNPPRSMGDVDFVVPPDRHKVAVETAMNFGFEITCICKHGTDLKMDMLGLDIHSRIFRENKKRTHEDQIFARARRSTAFGVEVLLPCPEDLMLSILNNAYFNIIHMEDRNRKSRWVHDCMDIFKSNPNFDFGMFIDTAKRVGVSHKAKALLKILSIHAPKIIPEDLFDGILDPDKNEEKLLLRDLAWCTVYAKKQLHKRLAANGTKHLKKKWQHFKAEVDYKIWKAFIQIPQLRLPLVKLFLRQHD
jgi:hypothetical protein